MANLILPWFYQTSDLKPYLSQAYQAWTQTKGLVDAISPMLVRLQPLVQAKQFLQGQLTCDMRDLKSGDHRLTAYCSIQGRVRLLLQVLVTDDACYLLLPREAGQHWLPTLQQHARFSRVSVEIASDWGVLPWIGTLPQMGGVFSLLLPGPILRYWIVGPQAKMAQSEDKAALSDWQGIEMMAGLPQFAMVHSERYVANLFGLERWQGLSWQKGCYCGQEIISRIHLRGQLQRRLVGWVGRFDPKLQLGGTCSFADRPLGSVLGYVSYQEYCQFVLLEVLAAHHLTEEIAFTFT